MDRNYVKKILDKIKYHENKANDHLKIAKRLYDQTINNLVDIHESSLFKKESGSEEINKTFDVICNIMGSNPKLILGVKSVRVNEEVNAVKKVFILIAIHLYGYKSFSNNYGHLPGFKRSTVSSFLNKRVWMYDNTIKIPLKDVMNYLSINELVIDFSHQFYDQKININDL